MSKKTILNIFSALILFGSAAKSLAENPIISIGLLEKWSPVELRIQEPAGTGVWSEAKLSRGLLWVNGKAQKRASWGTPESLVKIQFKNLTRIYPGQIILTAGKDQKKPSLLIQNLVPIEDYSACVAAFESGYDRSQPEYLKALGAVVRLYASSHLNRHPYYDLCDLSHCQVYQGVPTQFTFWKKVIASSRGFTFFSGLNPNGFYFHRSCGGALESADQIWGGSPSPSRTGPDEWNGQSLCRKDSFYRWTSSAKTEDVEGIFKSMARLPAAARLQNLEVSEKTIHGRNKTLLALFQLPDGSLREIYENAPRFASEFGRQYGWRTFPSLWFNLEKKGKIFQFKGRGFGHGVGFCQSGALELARMGWDFEKILGFYFPEKP